MNNDTTYREGDSEPRISPLVTMTIGELIRAIACGVAVGLITALIYFLMNKFVFGAVLCRPQSPANCSQAPNYAFIVAAIIAAIAGLATLVRMRIYRPLLVVLGAVVALWGIHTTLSSVAWYWGLLAAMLLFGIAYGLFAWLARIRSFILAIVVVIVAVVLVRFVLSM